MDRRAVLSALGVLGGSGCLRLQSRGESNPAPSANPTDQPTTPGTASPPQTRTATPEPTATTEPVYPFGLSAGGVTAALYPTHVDALSQTSFRSRWVKLDRTRSRTKWKKEYKSDSGRSLGTWTRQDGGPVEKYVYWDGGLWRERLGDRYTYGDDGNENWGYRPSVWGVEIDPLLRNVEWSGPTRVNETRPAVWEVTARRVENGATAPGYEAAGGKLLSVSSARMTVDENGVIRQVEAIYEIRNRDQEEVTYDITYQIDSLGTVSVSKPGWFSQANAASPTVTSTLTDGGQYVRLLIEDGNRIEPNSRISVFDTAKDWKFVIHLEEPVEPGTPAYLYAETSDQRVVEGNIARGERPSTASPVALDSSYEVAAFRRATQYFGRTAVT